MNRGSVVLDIWVASLLLMVAGVGKCAVSGSPLQYVNDINKCRDSKTNREMYIGEVFYRRGQCVRVQCLGSLQIWEDKCQVPKLEGICSEVPPANEFLDYPKCCPRYECKLYLDDNERTQETRIHDHYGNRISTYITQTFTRLVNGGTVGGDTNRNAVATQFKL